MPGLEPGDGAVSAAALTSVAQERLSLFGSWNKPRRFLLWAPRLLDEIIAVRDSTVR
jgi:hypothetical protein